MEKKNSDLLRLYPDFSTTVQFAQKGTERDQFQLICVLTSPRKTTKFLVMKEKGY